MNVITQGMNILLMRIKLRSHKDRRMGHKLLNEWIKQIKKTERAAKRQGVEIK